MDAHSNLAARSAVLVAQGMAMQQAADAAGAAQCYAQALELDPANVQAHYLCALSAVQKDQFEQAREHLDAACSLDPRHAAAAMLHGHVLNQLGAPRDALESLDRAAALMPDSALVWNYHAQALYALHRYGDALVSCEQALALAPDRTDMLCLCGILLLRQRRFADAGQMFSQFFAQVPARAQDHEGVAHGYMAARGSATPDADLLPSALHHLDRAVALQPDLAPAHKERGFVLEHLGKYQEALASYQLALDLKPDWDDAAYGAGRCLLTLGNWQDGWAAHERRWFLPHVMAARRETGAPPWRGEPLEGKSIAIVAEGGFGDVLQFFRFVEPVRALAASVSVMLPPALQRLLAPGSGPNACGPYDYHCPLLSLPYRLDTTLCTIPAPHGYLRADPALAAAWRQRLGPKTRLRVGLAWRGDPANGNDHNRSMPLTHLAGLLNMQNVEFICLQQVMRDADMPAHARMPRLAFYGAQLHDFAETAALCDCVDLVISVCSSVAHLAGAMGKPVWVLLTQPADWRWMQAREDSPWYARARLLRQSRQGDWDGVISRVRDSLTEQAELTDGPPAAP